MFFGLEAYPREVGFISEPIAAGLVFLTTSMKVPGFLVFWRINKYITVAYNKKSRTSATAVVMTISFPLHFVIHFFQLLINISESSLLLLIFIHSQVHLRY
jgi:hypothetical protein